MRFDTQSACHSIPRKMLNRSCSSWLLVYFHGKPVSFTPMHRRTSHPPLPSPTIPHKLQRRLISPRLKRYRSHLRANIRSKMAAILPVAQCHKSKIEATSINGCLMVMDPTTSFIPRHDQLFLLNHPILGPRPPGHETRHDPSRDPGVKFPAA